jgi:hypothetical protein
MFVMDFALITKVPKPFLGGVGGWGGVVQIVFIVKKQENLKISISVPNTSSKLHSSFEIDGFNVLRMHS